ncbi:hypothetical protein ACX9R5_04070 [Rathayibacter sp. CAU 1779]
MSRTRVVLTSVALAAVAALAGCTSSAPSADSTRTPTPLGSAKIMVFTGGDKPLRLPARAAHELTRVTLLGDSGTIETTAGVPVGIDTLRVTFACANQPQGMGYQVFVDGVLNTSGSVSSCDSKPRKEAVNPLTPTRNASRLVRLVLTGTPASDTEAYAILVGGD